MKVIVFIVAISLGFHAANSQSQVDVRFYLDSKFTNGEPNAWTHNVEELKLNSAFDCQLKITLTDDYVGKSNGLAPDDAIRNCHLLFNNETEYVRKIIQLPQLWQLVPLQGDKAIVPGPNLISLHYEKLELSSLEKVLFVGLENFWESKLNAGAVLTFLTAQCKTFKCVRLVGTLPKTRRELDAMLRNKVDGKIFNNWFFFDSSQKIYPESTWPSNWYYLRTTTDPVILNVPEKNEIVVFPLGVPNSTTSFEPLANSRNWQATDGSNKYGDRWITNPEDSAADFPEEIITLRDQNVDPTKSSADPVPITKFIAGKVIGKGNFGVVRLAKDLKNLGYIVIKEGKDLKYEYDIHTSIYKAANGMCVNGAQRLRIPTPLGGTLLGKRQFRYGMSALGPSLGGKEFLEWTRKDENKRVLLKYIIPQMIIQTYLFHKTGFLHLDIKPDNFMFGPWGQETVIFLADFTTSYNMEIPAKCRRGSPPYMSIDMLNEGNNHVLGWKDDYESLVYSIFQFLNNYLPWIDGISGELELEEFLKAVAAEKERIFISETPDKKINVKDAVWPRLVRFHKYIRQLTPKQMPNLQYMLDLFDLTIPLPPDMRDTRMKDSANTVIPYLTVKGEIEKTIFGIPRCQWRRYPIYEPEKNLPAEFVFDPLASSNATKPVLYVLEEAVIMITKDAPKRKYHAFVDFGIHIPADVNFSLRYAFLLPGTEEFIQESAEVQLVLVTNQPLEVVSGLAKYELFKKNFKFLHLGKDETLLTRRIVDENGKIQLPNNQLKNATYARGKLIKLDSNLQVAKSAFLEASFSNWHLPFFL